MAYTLINKHLKYKLYYNIYISYTYAHSKYFWPAHKRLYALLLSVVVFITGSRKKAFLVGMDINKLRQPLYL